MGRSSHFLRGIVGATAVCLAAVLASPLMAATVASAAPAAGPHFTFRTFNVPKAVYTDILGINNMGVMVGQYMDASHVAHGFITTGDHIVTVDVPGAYATGVQSVNDKGTAVGWWQQSLGHGNYLSHGFVRSPAGVITTIDDSSAGPKGYTEGVYGINDDGVLVGSFVDSKGVEHGFIDQHGRFTTVDNPKYAPSSHSGTELWAINDLGVIDGLGYSYPTAVKGFTVSRPASSTQYSYFTGVGDKGSYKSDGGTWPSGMNDWGAVVGHSNGWEGYGVFVGWEWFHGKMITISDPAASTKPGSDFAPGCGCFAGTAPGGINDAGTVVGIYWDSNYHPHGFIATPTFTSTTALKLSAAKVTYGDEQSETLSVGVSPQNSGVTPTGKVTVKEDRTTLCTIVLSSGKGSCTLSAKMLNVGTYHLVATYEGSKNVRPSTSAKETLTVLK